MSAKQQFRKLFGLAILIILVLGIPTQDGLAQSGPTQPEAMQFEPVDVTDVVNLATGDFVYTLPLMEVPGPEGSYPIVLSYHSDIGPNQPATWVGLGWTLNPGSINRTLSGYPDDYNGDLVKTHIQDTKDLDWGISIGAGWGPVGLNMTYDHYSGMIGANMMVTIGLGEGGEGFGISASVGTSGASVGVGYKKDFGSGISGSIGINAGTQGVGIGGGISKDLGESYENNLSLGSVGTSLSSKGGTNFKIGGTGFSSVTQSSGKGTVSSTGFSFKIPLPGKFWVSFGYQEREWKLDETYLEPSYGYLYQDKYFKSFENDKKYERQLQDDFLYASADIFNASAQGLNGTFTAYQKKPYRLFDKKKNDEKANLTNEWGSYYFASNDTKEFKFLDDPGGNVVEENRSANWGEEYDQIRDTFDPTNPSNPTPSRFSSRKVIPQFNSDTGKLKGFTIVSSDGKRYEFKQPIYNLNQYSQTNRVEYDSNFEQYTRMGSPYATSWLLTAIKGPDFVDRNQNEVADDGDWGYWVLFDYAYSQFEVWRAPFKGTSPSSFSEDTKSFSIGLRETVHLKTIETSTHRARFYVREFEKGNPPNDFTKLSVDGRRPFNFKGDFTWIEDIGLSSDTKVLKTRRAKRDERDDGRGGDSPRGETQTFYYSIDNLEFEYDEERKVTEIKVINGSSWRELVSGSLLLENFYEGGNQLSQKLHKVDLINKNRGNEVIKSTHFNYDFSLRPNSPGSIVQTSDGTQEGVLTLKSLQSFGQNDIPIAPPYKFEYAHGHPPGAGLNPSWHSYDWDHWGSYRDPGNGRGFHKHKTPQDKELADMSAAWSLTEITNPTGNKIEIEYESDDYFHVNNTFDLDKARSITIQNPETTTRKFRVDLENIKEGSVVQIAEHFEREECRDYYYDDCFTETTEKYYDKLYYVEEFESSTNTVTIDRPFRFQESYSSASDSEEFRYELVIPQNTYGGGSRVKRITTTNGTEKQTTLYSYKNGQYSSGVTTSLPAPYANRKHSLIAAPDSYLQAFMDHKYSYGRPAAGVIYSRVQVENTDEDGENINGKTVYEFYTSKDLPYTVDDQGDELIIKDRSGIYGKPKATTFFEKVGENKFRPIKRNEFLYAYSDQLHNRGSVYLKSNKIDDKREIPGVTQQKYAFKNKISDDKTVSRKVDHTYMNVYGVGSKSVGYFYGNDQEVAPSDSMTTISRPIGWDAFTGSPIVTAKGTSEKDETVVQESKPAYWKYDGMEDKNMLTQNFQQSTYKTDRIDLEDTTSLATFDTHEDELISSSVTTWSDHWYEDEAGSPKVWRKNNTYVYDRKYKYEDFKKGMLDDIDHDYHPSTKGIPWKQTSNITEYDHFGHVVESVSRDGRYSTTLYGPRDRLVKAVASNTANEEVQFYNYEERLSGIFIGHTGSRSNKVSGSTNLAYAPSKNPANAQAYKAQLWVLPSGGDLTIGGQTVSQGNSWQFVEVDDLQPGEALSIQGTGYVDDLAIIPETASLSSYTYDPLTGKVTSMIDANNNTSYFEYDDAGRLIAKRDMDKNLVSRFSYGYGHKYHINLSEEHPIKKQKITFEAQKGEATIDDAQKYTWDFGTGERLISTDSNVDYTFDKSGSKRVTVLITDKEGATLRVSKDVYIAEEEFSVQISQSPDSDYEHLTKVSATVTEGVSPYTYTWYTKDSTTYGGWQKVNGVDRASTAIGVSYGKSKKVKCKVRDADGQTAVSNEITISGPSCNDGDISLKEITPCEE